MRTLRRPCVPAGRRARGCDLGGRPGPPANAPHLTVGSADEFDRQHRRHRRAVAFGAVLRLDRSQDQDEPPGVYADPDGHPVYIFVVSR
ncbi:MAG: VOC family protein [Acidimicrobiales bacterium]